MFEALPLVAESPGDFAAVADAANRAARVWNLAPPNLIRFASNGVFECQNVVLRVSKPTASMVAALHLAEHLASVGVRVVRPARSNALTVPNGLEVTAWERVDHDPTLPVDWEQVGSMVAEVHDIDATTIDHPLPFCGDFPWWDLDTMMNEARDLDEPTIRALQRARHDNAWWRSAARSSPLVLCHGDVHPGNVLVDRNGPILIDWDLVCVGPRAWDHAPLMTWTRRWGGAPGIYEAFSEGYGPRSDDDMTIAIAIAEMRLLAATLMRLQRARVDPGQRDEALRRLRYWRQETDAPMWQAQ